MANNINVDVTKINEDNAVDYKSLFVDSIIKWIYTFIIALTPVLTKLLISKFDGKNPFFEISSEIIIVSIVIVSECKSSA